MGRACQLPAISLERPQAAGSMEWEEDGDIVNPVKPPRAKANVKAKSKPKSLPANAKVDSQDSDESNIDSESDSEGLENQGQTGGEAHEHGKRKCSGFCRRKTLWISN